MSGHERRTPPTKNTLPVPQEPRPVGVRVGNAVFTPVLPTDATNAAAIREHDNAFLGVLGLADTIFAAAEQIHAPRAIIYNPAAEHEAREEAQKELQHQRVLAKKRREKEIYEADTEALKARHRYEATEEFKEDKFEVGHARVREKVAKHGVGEAVARAAGIDGEILEPENKKEPKPSSLAQTFALRADELEKEIDDAEAAGRPTEELRNELNAVNKMLRRDLLRNGP